MDELPPLQHLKAPPDPRASWGLPAFGQLPTVERLDELTTRVLAPNPSPMTLDGTNTYVIGAAGSGEAVVVDPGPDDHGHLDRVRQELADRDAECVLVLVTHHHLDHAAAAGRFARSLGGEVAAPTRDVAGTGGVVIADGDRFARAGVQLEVVATPGHSADHCAFRVDTGALLSGDHVLGRGTSAVLHPDGDLRAYLESLRTVLALGPDACFPGHGPALLQDTTAVVDYYLAHREFRQQQVLAAVAEQPRTPAELVERIYADVDRALWPAAQASTRAALAMLGDEGRVRVDAAGRFHLQP